MLFGGLPLALISGAAQAGASDRVLVLLQLAGGNDGLNMVVPLDQYDNLAQVRGNILPPENSLLDLGNTLGLHPAMPALADVWLDGKLQILQSVGYPDQNRSHFRSQDIWSTASAADEFLTTGWLGRYFELDHAAYPFGYPNDDFPHPLALVAGTSVAETCQGSMANFSLSVTDPFNPGTVNAGVLAPAPEGCYGDELAFVHNVVAQTNGYADAISTAAALGQNRSAKYHANGFNYIAAALGTVARLISGGLKTRIFVVNAGGFDTHANQVAGADTTQGVHADLLQLLSDAICAFQDDLVLLGIQKKVIGMTFSEFGRRIRSNASIGTDHGTAAPLFLFGQPLNGGVFGQNPQIDPQVGEGDGVPMQIDFRDVFGTLLCDWLGVADSDVQSVLHPDLEKMPLVTTPASSFIFASGFE